MSADGQRFCLKWNDFRNSVTAVFEDLRQDEELVDITLCCEGKKVKAHRMMLSACSPYFRELLKVSPRSPALSWEVNRRGALTIKVFQRCPVNLACNLGELPRKGAENLSQGTAQTAIFHPCLSWDITVHEW